MTWECTRNKKRNSHVQEALVSLTCFSSGTRKFFVVIVLTIYPTRDRIKDSLTKSISLEKKKKDSTHSNGTRVTILYPRARFRDWGWWTTRNKWRMSSIHLRRIFEFLAGESLGGNCFLPYTRQKPISVTRCNVQRPIRLERY